MAVIQATSAVICTAGSPFMGWLSDRLPPHLLVRASAILFAAACLELMFTATISIWLFLPGVAINGVACALFWYPYHDFCGVTLQNRPTIQATVGNESKKEEADKDISRFAIFWSGGKALGYVVAGYIFTFAGGRYSLAVCAAATFSIIFYYPFRSSKKMQKQVSPEPEAYLPFVQGQEAPRISMDSPRPSIESSRVSTESPRPSMESRPSEDLPRTSVEIAGNDKPRNLTPEKQEKPTLQEKDVLVAASIAMNNSVFLPLVCNISELVNPLLSKSYLFNFCVYGVLNTFSSQFVNLIKVFI